MLARVRASEVGYAHNGSVLRPMPNSHIDFSDAEILSAELAVGFWSALSSVQLAQGRMWSSQAKLFSALNGWVD